jgi:alpha-L-fucosidase
MWFTIFGKLFGRGLPEMGLRDSSQGRRGRDPFTFAGLAACAGLASGALAQAQSAVATTPPSAEPASAKSDSHDARMAWWREARFGVFIHWGLYAIPAGQWNGKAAPSVGEWIQHTVPIASHEYQALAARFNPIRYDADAWVRAIKGAGARYVVITSKHHDGFCMFDSAATQYDIVDATPFGDPAPRDPLRELADACERHGVTLCFYYSIWDWHNPDFRRSDSGLDRVPMYMEYMKIQLRELLTNYGNIGVLWFDGEWTPEWTEERGREMEAFVRSIRPDIIVNNRLGKARQGMSGISAYKGVGDFETPEQEVPATGLPGVDWESCLTMNNTWGFRSDDHDWKSEKALLHTLVDIASKGGNLLLNVGPTAEGEIPAPSLERLAAMGRWMDVNAESIRGTSASPFRALRWGRVTTRTDAKGITLFLHVFAWPKAAGTASSSVILLPGLRTGATRASLLADAGTTLETRQSADGLEVFIPASLAAPDPVVSVIRLELVGPPVVEEVAIAPTQDGLFLLGPLDATTAAHGPKVEERGGGINLGLWTHKQAAAAWTIRVDKPGRFKVELLTSSLRAGHRAVIEVQDQTLLATIPQTDSWDSYVVSSPGEVTFTKPGNHTLRIAADGPFEVGLMNLRQLRLIPVPGSTP